MPIRIDATCRHCGVAIEPLDADDSGIVTKWIHVGLSIYCSGGSAWPRRSIATPTIIVEPHGRK
jgi:hypothetical protein